MLQPDKFRKPARKTCLRLETPGGGLESDPKDMLEVGNGPASDWKRFEKEPGNVFEIGALGKPAWTTCLRLETPGGRLESHRDTCLRLETALA